MNPEEVEFIAENKNVSIVPNFNFDRIYLISGDVGPFRAGLPVQVPIWMATNLRQRQKCRIIAPDWMDTEKLEQVKEEESQSRFFTKMPSEHYMVEAHLLLGVAAEDIPHADEIRTILKDIWDMRMSKLRSSVDAFIKTGGSYAKLDHLTAMEINSIRPLLPHALDELYKLQKVATGYLMCLQKVCKTVCCALTLHYATTALQSPTVVCDHPMCELKIRQIFHLSSHLHKTSLSDLLLASCQ